MGLTLHYSGTLTSPSILEALVAEVEDICQTMEWRYHLIDVVVDKDVPRRFIDEFGGYGANGFELRGISFQVHEKSESVSLSFAPDGSLVSLMNLLVADKIDDFDDGLIHWLFTKTHFAGPEAHVAICKLLKHLAGKYFSTFEVRDEADYYHSENHAELEERFAAYDSAYTSVTDAIAGAGLDQANSVEELMSLLAKVLPDAEIRYIGDEEE